MHYILGGIAIGSAVSILVIFNGRILGISGIIRGFLKNPFAEMSWRLLFILGLILSPTLYSKFFVIQTIEILSSPLKLILSGFLIGLGASLSNGCTSGHSVCGVSRLSKRSIIATVIMMLAAFITFNVTNLT